MTNPVSNKRKVLLINPKFQLSFIGYMTGMSIFAALVFYAANSYFFWKFRSLGNHIGLPPDHIFFRFISEQQITMNWIFLIMGLVTVVGIVAGGAYMSHRVAGPLYRLHKHMNRVASGETSDPVEFREKDFFPELATAYNEQLQHLSRQDKPKQNAA